MEKYRVWLYFTLKEFINEALFCRKSNPYGI